MEWMENTMTVAITPGTFDPITYGHLDIVKRASTLADEVIVAVADSTPKHTLFTVEERASLAREAVVDLPNVRVESFDGLLIDYARSRGAKMLVKGLRAITDFEYEFQMAALNSQLGADLETIFIMSPPQYMYLSSSVVRELASLHADLSKFVPPCVEAALREKFAHA
jgi:pantetheine-phosphate adenylyltransferase